MTLLNMKTAAAASLAALTSNAPVAQAEFFKVVVA